MEQQQPQQPQQVFEFNSLTGQEVETIMNALNELQSKVSRPVMNKLEQQIVQQIQAQQLQVPQPPDTGKSESNKDKNTEE